jgi:trimeric autotransporter adhesin
MMRLLNVIETWGHHLRARFARRALLGRILFTVAFCSMLLLFSSIAQAATFTVNNSGNANDNNAGNGTCATAAGVCTLRAAIQEANALAGTHTINFNIPTTDANYSAARRVVTMTPNAALPAITSAGLTINGTSQPNTNTGVLGVGGTVGVDALSLLTVNVPDIEIVGTSAIAVGLDVQASNVTIRGIAIYGFGTTPNSDTSGNIRINIGFTGTMIRDNVLGSTATSFPANYAGAALSLGDNIRSVGADNGTIRDNLIGFSAGKGIQLGGGSNGWTVQDNEVRGNGIGNANLDGIDIENGSGSNTVSGNRFEGNEADGVDMYSATGNNTIVNNTITRNGTGGAGVETAGIRIYGTGSVIDRNIINANYGAGVAVTSGATQNTITRNSMFDNGTITNKAGGAASGQIGIDLLSAADNQNVGTSPYLTQNDSTDADAGGNGLLNFAVFTNAAVSAGNLILTGYARPGSTIEFFIAKADASGFGEGQTYVTTLTEGSASDTDATTGTYNIAGLGTDTTNKFKFTIPVPGGVAVGTTLTATATLAGATSEFSKNITVVQGPDITLTKTYSINTAFAQSGTEITYTITFVNNGGTASAFTIFDMIPANTEFKVGSLIYTPIAGGVPAPVPSYSNAARSVAIPPQPPSPWVNYTPVGTYDPQVTYIRWVFGTNIANGASAKVSFVVRIQ